MFCFKDSFWFYSDEQRHFTKVSHQFCLSPSPLERTPPIPSWLFHSHFTEKFIFLSADLHFCLIVMSFLLQPLLSSAKPSLKKLSQASCCIHFQDVFRLKVEIHCTLALAQWLRAGDWILYILNKSVSPFIPSHNGKGGCKTAAMLFFYAQFPIANWKRTRTPFKGWMSTNERSGL